MASCPARRRSGSPAWSAPPQARRLCLFGEYVTAPEALRIGLVDRVVAADELAPTARSLAERAASFSPGTLRELKALLRVAPSLDDDGYAATYLSAQQRCLDEHDKEQEPTSLHPGAGQA